MAPRKKKTFIACKTEDLQTGERLIFDLGGRSVGVFNIDDEFFAMHNRCPHTGGTLCEGPICGTALPTDGYEFIDGREGELVRCGWHGWEFDIKTGQALVDPKMRAKTFPVTVENGDIIVHI